MDEINFWCILQKITLSNWYYHEIYYNILPTVNFNNKKLKKL